MQAYSLDLRQRVVSADENGSETIREVAERFAVSDSFIKKLLQSSVPALNTPQNPFTLILKTLLEV